MINFMKSNELCYYFLDCKIILRDYDFKPYITSVFSLDFQIVKYLEFKRAHEITNGILSTHEQFVVDIEFIYIRSA